MHELVFRNEAQAAMHEALLKGPAQEAETHAQSWDSDYGAMGNPVGPTPEAEATPDTQADPVSQEDTPAVPTAPAPETPSEPTSKKPQVFGKYEDLQQAEKGYFEIVKAYNAERDARAAAEARIAALANPTPAQPVAPRQMPVSHQPPSEDMAELLKTLESDGVDATALTKVIEEITTRKAADLLEARLGPREAQERASAYIATKYPDAGAHADEILAFVSNDNDTRQRVESYLANNDLVGAQEIAILRYKNFLNSSVENTLLAASTATEQENARALKHATAIKGAGQSGVRVAEPKGPTSEQLQALAERARMGDTVPYMRATIGASLTDPIFSQDYEG